MDKGKWETLVAKIHQDQAIWFLNAFWNDGVKQKAEDLWDYNAKVGFFSFLFLFFSSLCADENESLSNSEDSFKTHTIFRG